MDIDKGIKLVLEVWVFLNVYVGLNFICINTGIVNVRSWFMWFFVAEVIMCSKVRDLLFICTA